MNTESITPRENKITTKIYDVVSVNGCCAVMT